MKQNNWFTVKRIKPQVYALAEFKHFEKVISYLVVGTSHAMLFDTGLGYRSIHKAIKGITDLPIRIFLTHSHWDHTGGLLNRDIVYSFKDMSDKHIVRIDDIEVQCIYTPGHTPDSVCYYLPKLNIMVLGDTFYPGPLYAHMPESNVQDYARSLSKIARIVSLDTILLPGHNAVTCTHLMIKDAALLMKKVAKSTKTNIHEMKGNGFSILLP